MRSNSIKKIILFLFVIVLVLINIYFIFYNRHITLNEDIKVNGFNFESDTPS